MAAERKRLLTGDRPTGSLHLGHVVGSLLNRIKLQDQYDCYFLVADLHLLTTRPTKDDITAVRDIARQMVLDYAAVGMNMTRSVWYLQSAVPEVAELTLYLSMLTSVPRLQRLPSLKDMKEAAALHEMPYGLLGYPVLQAADILLPRAHIVPVGKDNEAHVELARELARRFNTLYDDTFPVPAVIVGDVPALVGTDGSNKMSKSLGNAIMISDDARQVEKRVMSMYTDPARIRADIPGTVEGNPLFIYHDTFNDNAAAVAQLKERYRRGAVGDVEVKQRLAAALNRYLQPMRERRARYAERQDYSEQILYDGTQRMRQVAQETIVRVRKAMGLAGIWNRISRRARAAGVPAADTAQPAQATAPSGTAKTEKETNSASGSGSSAG